MEAGGGYNRRSAVQAAGASPALPLLEEAAADVVLPAGGAAAAIVVADYGSSAGRNSLAPIGRALAILRGRAGRERAISVVHTDLPGNDFNALFALLATDPDSYARHDPEVYASAVGTSFYRQILPSESVTLGWSSWAVQWLSRTPPIPDSVHVASSRDGEARAAYALQAAHDWQDFLRCRSREMQAGGRLVVLTMASTDEDDFGYRGLLAALNDSLEELVAGGLVRDDEVERMAIPTYGRTRAEFAAPFVAGNFAGLTLQRLEVFQGDDEIWRRFTDDEDAAAYGAAWAAFSRASVFPTLTLGLDGGAQDPRVEQFVARLEAGISKRLASAPEPSVIPLAAVVLAR